MEENKVTLSSPWTEYYNKLCTLFMRDPDVRVSMADDPPVITVRVANAVKADALAQLLPEEMVFGNVVLQIRVVPANEAQTREDLLRCALYGNPVVSSISHYATIFGEYTYVMFKPIVAQYYNDNMRDPHGITTTVYQELAREILGEDAGTVYCTEDAR